MKYLAGIDPGLSGAIALMRLDDVGPLEILDMPTFQVMVNGKKRRRFDLTALARWFDLHAKDIKEVVLENPQARPAMNSASVFGLGFSVGVAQAMVSAHFVPIRLVAPAAWKKAMGLTADKDATRMIASQRLPTSAHLWPNKGHDGRAEAALLALYGKRFQVPKDRQDQ